MSLEFDHENWVYSVLAVLQTSEKLSALKLNQQIVALVELMKSDEVVLEGLRELVTEYSQVDDETSTSDMITMLVNFEKVGIKKTPERHAVLKAIKDKLDS